MDALGLSWLLWSLHLIAFVDHVRTTKLILTVSRKSQTFSTIAFVFKIDLPAIVDIFKILKCSESFLKRFEKFCLTKGYTKFPAVCLITSKINLAKKAGLR